MKPQKAIIFDSGTLISLSLASLTEELRGLKKIFSGKFIITKEVKKEVIDKPLNIKKFELEALRIQALLNEGVLEMPSIVGVNENELSKKTEEVKSIANSTFHSFGKDGRDIHLIDDGEASCLALSKMLSEKGIDNVIAVDERTTRMLGENPENLRKLMIERLHVNIQTNKENYKLFSGMNFIRSSELVYVAYKKGLFKLKDPQVLDAALYAVKFKGAAISGEEIEEIKRLK